MIEEIHIRQHLNALKLRAAQRYNISPEKCHVGHLMLQGMLENPDLLNQIDGATGESETNISVATRSVRLASALMNFGLKPGDTIVVMGPNLLDVAIPYYANHYCGLSMCTIDHSVNADDLIRIFPVIKPKIAFCSTMNEDTVRKAFAGIENSTQIVIYDDKNNNIEKFIQDHNGTDENFRPAEFNHSEIPAWLMLTSGTTGQPKVAMMPYETALNGVSCWWEDFTMKVDLVLMLSTIQWLSGLINFMTAPLRNFTRLQCSQKIDPKLMIGMIHKYRPMVTTWTPFLLAQFVQMAGNVCDISSFKYILIGGAAVEQSLLDKFAEITDARLFVVYGMTELLAPIFKFDQQTTPAGSVGKSLDRYEYKLLDNDGQIVTKPFKSGELWVKGDAFFKGYMNNPEETQKMLTDDGWLKTGDIFYRDENNFYFFVERKRLLIRYYSNWVSPLEVEGVIKRHPGVAEACVVGVQNTPTMELTVAAIVKKEGCDVEPKEIFDLVKNALPDSKQLHGGLFFLDSLPMTPSAKLHRSKILEMATTMNRIMPS